MIVYTPFWRMMKERKHTTYTLRVKMGIGNSTVQRLQKNMPLTTTTLDDLCKLFHCTLPDIAEYVEDEPI